MKGWILAVAMLLASCGGDSSSGGNGPSETTPSDTVMPEPTLVLEQDQQDVPNDSGHHTD